MEILRDITERKQYQNELERLSITDKLTGLYNRRYFDEALEKEVLRARRFKHDLSLMFIDIDNFKHFNDTYGHTEGDAVLQRIGLLIKEQVRNEIDIACRYGGEEFTIILPETASSSATAIADRLIRDFKSIKFHIPSKNETIQKTISIGIADVNVSNNAKVLLDNADKAMYEAKNWAEIRYVNIERKVSVTILLNLLVYSINLTTDFSGGFYVVHWNDL